MIEYLIDNMVVNNPRFQQARDVQKLGYISYRIIEEIAHEARYNSVDAARIKDESFDHQSIERLSILSKIAPEMIDAGVLKLDEGNGDVMLVVDYLAQKNTPSLLVSGHVLVSDDYGLVRYCKAKNIPTLSSESFFIQMRKYLNA